MEREMSKEETSLQDIHINSREELTMTLKESIQNLKF
jgi:hypothetical protein